MSHDALNWLKIVAVFGGLAVAIEILRYGITRRLRAMTPSGKGFAGLIASLMPLFLGWAYVKFTGVRLPDSALQWAENIAAIGGACSSIVIVSNMLNKAGLDAETSRRVRDALLCFAFYAVPHWLLNDYIDRNGGPYFHPFGEEGAWRAEMTVFVNLIGFAALASLGLSMLIDRVGGKAPDRSNSIDRVANQTVHGDAGDAHPEAIHAALNGGARVTRPQFEE